MLLSSSITIIENPVNEGALKDVPDTVLNVFSGPCSTIFTPGQQNNTSFPLLEKSAIFLFSSNAPTAIAVSYAAG